VNTNFNLSQKLDAVQNRLQLVSETGCGTVITKQWANRQQQIERVMVSTVGMYEDLQAIAEKTLLEIEGLELNALSPADNDVKEST
jgi:hypothetical protein